MGERVVAEITYGGSGMCLTATATVDDQGEWQVRLAVEPRHPTPEREPLVCLGSGDSYREARDVALAGSNGRDGWRYLAAELDCDVFVVEPDEHEPPEEDDDDDDSVHM